MRTAANTGMRTESHKKEELHFLQVLEISCNKSKGPCILSEIISRDLEESQKSKRNFKTKMEQTPTDRVDLGYVGSEYSGGRIVLLVRDNIDAIPHYFGQNP